MAEEGLNLNTFFYDLPDDRIAKHPLNNRSDSKLAFYNDGKLAHYSFHQLPSLLPSNVRLVFNDTKVIPARIVMKKATGARIELFLLEPISPSSVHEEIMHSKGECKWVCMIGNAKKWPVGSEIELNSDTLNLRAERLGQQLVKFRWYDTNTFSDILSKTGQVPLPPYLNREAEDEDNHRYQTVYSKFEGAVAAPTAGLHFTDEVFESLKRKEIKTDFLTLHVSAGTFQPVKVENVAEHKMHAEQVWVSLQNVRNLQDDRITISVGTTSMRTLESLYWFGAKLSENPRAEFHIEQFAYEDLPTIPRKESFRLIEKYMEENDLKQLNGMTEIMIMPGYTFQVCQGLITNFHQPKSTLIMLIAAFIGNSWANVYQAALENNYRFLSYGDSSLLIPNPLT